MAVEREAALRVQLAEADIVAPAAGVLVRAPADGGAQGERHVRQRLSEGDLIGLVARSDAFVVEVMLNEADADLVRSGQTATITVGGTGAMPRSGVVIGVAGEAVPQASGMGAPVVTARIRIVGTAGEIQALRVGSTANVTIKIYEAPQAIVVPPQAILGAAPIGQVRVVDPTSGEIRPRVVEIGYVGVEGVEIKSGLKAGETIVWHLP